MNADFGSYFLPFRHIDPFSADFAKAFKVVQIVSATADRLIVQVVQGSGFWLLAFSKAMMACLFWKLCAKRGWSLGFELFAIVILPKI